MVHSEAIGFRVASEYFAPMRKQTRLALRSLKFTTPYQQRIVPAVGAMLLFGRDRLDHFPDAWVQMGRFAGGDKLRMIDSAATRAHLPGVAEIGTGPADPGRRYYLVDEARSKE